jgi:hypothetical protein
MMTRSQAKGEIMPRKPVPHAIRFPDYGIPNSVVQAGSSAQKILYFALFKKCAFSYEQHMAFRIKQIRKDLWLHGMNKMVGLGYMAEAGNGEYIITVSGADAVRRIGNRNATRRSKANESKDA